MEYMSYISTKDAFEKELSCMGKWISLPIISIHSDGGKAGVQVIIVYELVMNSDLFIF